MDNDELFTQEQTPWDMLVDISHRVAQLEMNQVRIYEGLELHRRNLESLNQSILQLQKMILEIKT